jgi:hypothetical protein
LLGFLGDRQAPHSHHTTSQACGQEDRLVSIHFSVNPHLLGGPLK